MLVRSSCRPRRRICNSNLVFVYYKSISQILLQRLVSHEFNEFHNPNRSTLFTGTKKRGPNSAKTFFWKTLFLGQKRGPNLTKLSFWRYCFCLPLSKNSSRTTDLNPPPSPCSKNVRTGQIPPPSLTSDVFYGWPHTMQL